MNDAPDIRIIVCPTCGGDGGYSVETSFDPFKGQIGYCDYVCEACEGKGEYEVEVEPVEMEDLDAHVSQES